MDLMKFRKGNRLNKELFVVVCLFVCLLVHLAGAPVARLTHEAYRLAPPTPVLDWYMLSAKLICGSKQILFLVCFRRNDVHGRGG